jgi:hypothetical protein
MAAPSRVASVLLPIACPAMAPAAAPVPSPVWPLVAQEASSAARKRRERKFFHIVNLMKKRMKKKNSLEMNYSISTGNEYNGSCIFSRRKKVAESSILSGKGLLKNDNLLKIIPYGGVKS